MEHSKLLELLEDMSVDEKVNQLFQAHASFYEDQGIATGPVTEQGFSQQSAEQAGSVLSVVGAAKLKQIQERHMKQHPHQIPLLFMADIINGYKTIFPIPLAQGAAFNPEVARTGAQVAAREASAAGLHVTFSPMLDLVRDARWGRVMESNGEDPYLNSTYAKALVEGYQGKDAGAPGKIGACVKHFAAYGAPIAGRDYNNVELSERTLRDDYLPAYEAAVKAGALLVMTSFNTLNRIPSTANKWLMREILRGEMGFDGVLISDWAAIEEIMNHNLAADRKEAAKLAIEAGTDIDMMTTCYTNYLKELITQGEVPQELLDEAVLRVLELKNKLRLFENPYKDADEEAEKRLLLCEEHRQKARQAAAETFVLLENDQILPLQKEEKVAFIGPYAEERGMLGAWSIFGDNEDVINIREGIEGKGANAVFEKGSDILGPCEALPGFHKASMDAEDMQKAETMIERAVSVAKTVEKVVLCLGEHVAHTGEGASRANLTIPEIQSALLRRVAEVNANIAVVLFTGRPLDIREIKALARAVLVVWMPGTEGGNAIADVLYGDVCPSGKLSMSFPYSVGQVPIYYNQFQTGRFYDGSQPGNRFVSRYLDIPNEPLYPFGYGLSYSEFQYGQVMLKQDKDIQVSVKVKNIGNVRAAEAVQMYIRDDKGSVVRPVRELKGYQKLWLEPDEEREVSFVITEDMLKFHDINMDYKAEAGSFTVYVGSDSATENKAVFAASISK